MNTDQWALPSLGQVVKRGSLISRKASLLLVEKIVGDKEKLSANSCCVDLSLQIPNAGLDIPVFQQCPTEIYWINGDQEVRRWHRKSEKFCGVVALTSPSLLGGQWSPSRDIWSQRWTNYSSNSSPSSAQLRIRLKRSDSSPRYLTHKWANSTSWKSYYLFELPLLCYIQIAAFN